MTIDQEKIDKVNEILEDYALDLDQCEILIANLEEAMENGLKAATHDTSSIKMFPSYVTKIPNGKETGRFLALDLGGTNYRVLLVVLHGKGQKEPTITERRFAVPRNVMSGTGEELFDYIAGMLKNFLEEEHLEDANLPLGFTFSFPCEQRGLTDAVLTHWTKGFSSTGVEGKNVCALLQDSIDKLCIKVKCVAVLNDTVGTLASLAIQDSKCAIGLIVGTGTNAAYIERTNRVELMEDKSAAEVVINTEWGAYGDNGELSGIRTHIDDIVDQNSLYPGKQLFEKMISGMYLGEIVRLLSNELVEKGLLFKGVLPEKFKLPNTISTKVLTEVSRDPERLLHSAHYVLSEDLGVPIVSTSDARIFRNVCQAVTERAACLVGSGIACLIRRMNRYEVVVGIDGSLYKFQNHLHFRMMDLLDKLLGDQYKFTIRHSEDGSGKGAAAIAAAAMH